MKYRKAIFIILFSLIVCILVGESNVLIPSNEEAEITSYLRKNRADITQMNDLHELLNQDINNNQVFLIGESHGIMKNAESEWMIIQYLILSTDIRYIMYEIGPSEASLLNKYLVNGDKKILDKIFGLKKGTINYSVDNYEFWNKVYQFNKDRAKDNKISVIGIDIEQLPSISLFYLNEKFNSVNSEKVKSDFTLFFNDLKEVSGSSITDQWSSLKVASSTLLDQISKKESEFYDEFQDELVYIKIVLKNLIIKAEFEDLNEVESIRVREKAMYDNFIALFSSLPKGKVVGVLGRDHIFLKAGPSKLGENTRFGMMLNDSSVFENKVISFAIVYNNCEKYNIFSGEPFLYQDTMNTMSSLNHIEKDKAKTILYRLNSRNSPFNKYQFFVQSFNEFPTTDYFQYILFIQESEASKMLGGFGS